MLWHAMMASVLFQRFDAISFCARTYPNATAHALAPFKDVVLDACRFFQNTTNQQRALKAEFNAVLAGKIGAFNPGVHRVKVTEWQGLLETLRSQKMELDPLKNS
jgi:hypothetical protein